MDEARELYTAALTESHDLPTPSPEDWVADYNGMLEAWRAYLHDVGCVTCPADAYVKTLIEASAFYKYMAYMAANYFSA